MPSEQRPAPSPLVVRPPNRTNTISSIRSTSNSIANSTRNAAGSFAGSVRQTTKDAMNADVPLGAWAAAAETTSKAPTLGDIRKGSFSDNGWTTDGQMDAQEGRRRRASSGSSGKVSRLRSAAGAGIPRVDAVKEHRETEKQSEDQILIEDRVHATENKHATMEEEETAGPQDTLTPISSAPEEGDVLPLASRNQRVYSSGWRPPPKLPWTKSWMIGLKAFGKWFITPFGFFWTIYGLNVVAWGGMLFLLLCGAAPEMCWAPVGNGEYVRDCNHIDSARRIWLEIDSQILNALFCVTGFGLLPWRARDLYYLLRWRLCSKSKPQEQKLYGLRRLAGFYTGWFRLPGSDTLSQLTLAEYNAQHGKPSPASNPASPSPESNLTHDPRLPLPLSKTPPEPLTGIRAPPTALWKLDFYIWCNMWNTFFQACLCGVMWGLNRYDRPSWTTGFFIACACVVAGVGGVVAFKEGKKVKRVEGVAPSAAVQAELEKMYGDGVGAGGWGKGKGGG